MQVCAARPDRDSASPSCIQFNRIAANSGSCKKRNWQFILTGDESWFFYRKLNSRIWLPPDAEKPEVARQLINILKIRVTVFWNPGGLYVNRFLESGTSVNSAYFAEYVLGDVELLPALQTAR
jgi:hypothetical protein